MYIETLWSVHTTILQRKHNNAVCVCCWATCHCQLYTNTGWCTTILLW